MDTLRNDSESAGDPRSGKTRGRPKSRSDAVQRDLIVAAARAIFLDAGYSGMTMDVVATRCGMSKRTLYRLFPAKLDLLRAMVADHRRSMLALPREDDDGPVEAALAAIFRLDSDERETGERIAFIRLALAEGTRFPEVVEVLGSEGAAVSLTMLAHWLERQARAGRVTVAKPAAAARMLMDMVFGVFIRRFPEDRILTHPDRIAHARACIGVFLDGVRTRPDGAPGSRFGES